MDFGFVGYEELRQQQHEHPEYFLFSNEEGNLLQSVYNVCYATTARYYRQIQDALKATPKDEQALADIRNKHKGEVLAEMERLGLSVDTIKQLLTRYRRKKYWYHTGTHRVIEGAKEKVCFYYTSNNKHEGTLHEKDNPAFFEAGITVRKQAEMLKIPKAYLFIIPVEESMIGAMLDFWKAVFEEGQPLAPQSGFFTTKSSLLLGVFSDIGRKSIEESRNPDNVPAVELKVNDSLQLRISTATYNPTFLESSTLDKIHKMLQRKAYDAGYSSNVVELTISEYLEMTGNSDRKEAANALKAFVRTLEGAKYHFESDNEDFGFVNLAQEAFYVSGKGKGRTESYIHVKWGDRYIQHERETKQFIRYDEKILKIPSNKRNAYRIAVEFQEQKRRNIGKEGGIENKLSTETLLSRCVLPPYEKLAQKSQAGQKIITPFMDALNELTEKFGIFKSWKFTHSGTDKPLTDEEEMRVEVDYQLFKTLNVVVEWATEPDYTHLLERKQIQAQRIAAANTPKKKRGRPRKILQQGH